ncbi:hypothetical protein ZWY2020_037817 [Hordeum vulgare]|nr:hypothetical protein ZWY2020_037817 [Hordeum vulgare]
MGRDLHLILLAVLLVSSLVAAAKSADEDVIFGLAKLLSNPPSSWGASGDVCVFDGITCERGGSGRVTSIDLGDMGLTGTLPTSLSSLTALKELHLQGNALHGDFSSLAGCTDLTRLVLDGNGFTSSQVTSSKTCPPCNTSAWRTCHCRGPSLTPLSAPPSSKPSPPPMPPLRVPSDGSRQPVVIKLNNQMSDGKLSGSIDVVAAMKNLRLLWIQSNKFTGPIPDFSNSQLEAFNVRDNRLTGADA